MIILYVFISIVVIHAIYNIVNYLRFNYIDELLIGNCTTDVELKRKAKTHKNSILNYIKNSGVKDKYIHAAEPLGLGQISVGNVSIFDNILNQREDIFFAARDLLLEAKGNYWSRFINSINPLYWLRIILYIPKYLLSYLGVKPDSLFIKIFQLAYWLICIICTFALAIFPEEIKNFILSIY